MALQNEFGALNLESTQSSVLSNLVSILAKLNASVAVTGPLTDTQLRAALVPVTGPLTDTQLRATAVAVNGPLTDTQLRATAVAISGTVAVSGSVAVTGPLTDTQIRATALPVSGTVAVSTAFNLEATQAVVRADLDERFSGGKTAFCTTLTAAGDNTVLTPTVGTSLRVVWVSAIPSSDNSAANLVKFKFGTGGTPFYIAYAIAHWEPFQGAVNTSLVVNCATSEAVSISVHYRQV